MGLTISSGEYEVVGSGVVTAFDENGTINFHYMMDDKFQFSFNLILSFKNDETGNQIIHRTVTDNTIEFECCNFNDSGTGTSKPISLASSKGKTMYIRFWCYFDGDMAGKNKTRKVEYTFFVGE